VQKAATELWPHFSHHGALTRAYQAATVRRLSVGGGAVNERRQGVSLREFARVLEDVNFFASGAFATLDAQLVSHAILGRITPRSSSQGWHFGQPWLVVEPADVADDHDDDEEEELPWEVKDATLLHIADFKVS
jgi:hypothetical protein